MATLTEEDRSLDLEHERSNAFDSVELPSSRSLYGARHVLIVYSRMRVDDKRWNKAPGVEWRAKAAGVDFAVVAEQGQTRCPCEADESQNDDGDREAGRCARVEVSFDGHVTLVVLE